jgi:hypothetical protein
VNNQRADVHHLEYLELIRIQRSWNEPRGGRYDCISGS